MENTKKRVTESRIFNFYGTKRHNLAGVHPHERCSESEEFSEDVFEVYDEDGEIAEWEPIPESRKAMYDAVEARARDLLRIWKDQPGVEIQEREGETSYVYREAD